MIAKHGTSKLRLSEADLKLAIQMFIREHTFSNAETVESIQVHRPGSKYAASAIISRPEEKTHE